MDKRHLSAAAILAAIATLSQPEPLLIDFVFSFILWVLIIGFFTWLYHCWKKPTKTEEGK